MRTIMFVAVLTFSAIFGSVSSAEDCGGSVKLQWTQPPPNHAFCKEPLAAAVTATEVKPTLPPEIEYWYYETGPDYAFEWSTGGGTQNGNNSNATFSFAASGDKEVTVKVTVTAKIDAYDDKGQFHLYNMSFSDSLAWPITIHSAKLTIDSGLPGADYDSNIPLNAVGGDPYGSKQADVKLELTPHYTGLSVEARLDKKDCANFSGGLSATVTDGGSARLTGTSPGQFTITPCKPGAGAVGDAVTGNVFQFKFTIGKSTSDNPKGKTSVDTEDDSGQYDAKTGSGAAGAVGEVYISQNFEMKIVTDPAGCYGGKVKASAKVSHVASTTGVIAKGAWEEGGGIQIKVGVSFITFVWTANGPHGRAGVATDMSVQFGGGKEYKLGSWSFSSDDFGTGGMPFATEVRKHDGKNIQSDEETEYVVGSTVRSLRTSIGISGTTSKEFNPLVGSGAAVGSESMIDGGTPPLVEEADGLFNCQQ